MDVIDSESGNDRKSHKYHYEAAPRRFVFNTSTYQMLAVAVVNYINFYFDWFVQWVCLSLPRYIIVLKIIY